MKRLLALVLPLAVVACQDVPQVTAPPEHTESSQVSFSGQDLAAWFRVASPEVLALPRTVFADHDRDANRLVFGVENEGVVRGVRNVLTALQIPAVAYEVRIVEPIHFMSTLRSEVRPTLGGLQIHWSNYVCTLGFNVDHAGGRSFITNSHCTDNQGTTGNTQYNQPSRTVSPDPIAFEAHDPSYFRGGVCPRGRVCRYSDAARALYVEGMQNLGRIAKTDGLNTGSLTLDGSFDITSQDNSSTSFATGTTMYKVGRTTGWTSGTVSNSCATVNVAGSNITLLCQTLVSSNQQIVAGGDSGSPVFTGTSNVTLRGILWGGSGGGDLFVFSPMKNVQDELGSMNATTGGVGGGGGNGDDPPPDEDNGDEPNCPPNSNNPRCR